VTVADQFSVRDTLHRYCSTIDRFDHDGLRAIIADDAVAKFGDDDWIRGADAIVEWIADVTRRRSWQQHFLSVYHVDFISDVRAVALSYVTSRQVDVAHPTVVVETFGQYDDIVAREDDGRWKIVSKQMTVGQRDRRALLSG
jgi:hypothetical protein